MKKNQQKKADKKVETKFSRYDGKRLQVVQIKCRTDLRENETVSEYVTVMDAIEKLQKANGYKDAKTVFLQCMLGAAEKLKK